MIEFRAPFAFGLLVFLPLYYALRALRIFRKLSFPLTLSDWDGESFVWRKKLRTVVSVCAEILFAAAFVALVAALAEPVVAHRERVYTSRSGDVLFVLDTSPSMAARDIGGMTRLEAAKAAIASLAADLGGAAFGIVATASEAAVIVPPTTDRAAFAERLASLSVGMLGDGSALGMGLGTAVYHLAGSSSPVKCIVLITDGENNAGAIHPDTAAELAEKNDIVVYTLGIGTRGTVAVEYTDAATGKRYSGYLESKYDAAPLRRIAEKTGGRAFEIQSLDALAAALSEATRRLSVRQTYYYRSVTEPRAAVCVRLALLLLTVGWLIRRLYLKEIW